MAILVPRWLDFSLQVRLQMCLKFCMVIFANRIRALTRSTITFYPTIPHCQILDEAILSTWQQLEEEHRRYRTARLGSGTICENHHTNF
jgi:hypothetical protein